MGSEIACVYAALILHDEGLEISAENISKILKASNVT
ncbi:60s acidic ribosomal protein p1, partial [Chrysochromulina tobinii]